MAKKEKIVVISLGGSLIVPHHVDWKYVKYFCSYVEKLSWTYKTVIVCGGGSLAREYITALQHETHKVKVLSYIGIGATKLNARLVSGFLEDVSVVAETMDDVVSQLNKQRIVVCGALGFKPNMTSDGTAAEVAAYVGADAFVNLTNVSGLFSRDPHKFKSAKLIPFISFAAFLRHAREIAYTPGQHFVLDQQAARIILRERIRTFILDGHDVKNLELCLLGKSFVGTVIHE